MEYFPLDCLPSSWKTSSSSLDSYTAVETAMPIDKENDLKYLYPGY